MVNVISSYTLSFAVLTAFAVAAYFMHSWRKKEFKNILPLIGTLIAISAIYFLITAAGSPNYYNALALDLCIALVSTMLAVFYISKPYVFLSLMAILLVGIFVYASGYPGNNLFIGMFAIGTISGLLYREFALNTKKWVSGKKRRETEVRRDIIQMIMGAVVVAVILLLGHFGAVGIVFALALLGYIANNILANLIISPTYKKAADLERKNVSYGLGAVYLAAGTALMLGFTSATPLLLFGIVALFFGDAVATIVGINTKMADTLPYNRNKTRNGTYAFFIVVAIIGFFLIGWYAILLAALLAFIESIDVALDDNVRIGIVIVVIAAVLKIAAFTL
jgi:dolichol kinase